VGFKGWVRSVSTPRDREQSAGVLGRRQKEEKTRERWISKGSGETSEQPAST